MRFPFSCQALTVTLLFSVSSCGLFKKKGGDVVLPERVLEVGAEYAVEDNTPFYFEGVEDAEPDRFLRGGTRVVYVGPGLTPESVIVRADDGMEGFVDAKTLAEVPPKAAEPRSNIGATEPPLPMENPAEVVPSIPRIRTDNPRGIAPRPIEPRL